MQPVAADDVAAVLADVAVGEPLGGTVEVAGPEPIRMDELVRDYLAATHDSRTVSADPGALLRRRGERPEPHPRRQPPHRPDPVRGVAQLIVPSPRISLPVARCNRRVGITI
jgi:uncharacterized protein YbjT (DUF2867 family)